MTKTMSEQGKKQLRAAIAALLVLSAGTAPALAGSHHRAHRDDHRRAQVFASHGLAPQLEGLRHT